MPRETTQTPGFLDVRALVARAGSAPSHEVGPPAASPPDANGSGAPQPRTAQASDAPEPEPKPKPKPKPKAADAPLPTAGRWMKVAVVVVAFVLVTLGVLLLLPRIVHDRIVASAREIGIELTIEKVGVGFGGVTLRGVAATFPRAPAISARAEEIFASGVSAKEVRIRRLEVSVDGPVDAVAASLAPQLVDLRRRAAGTGGEARHLSLVDARLSWSGIFGEGSRLLASDVGAEIDTPGAGGESLHGSVGRFEITTPRTTLGPWSSSFESSPQTRRLRLLFDPPVPDGPSALVVWGEGTATQVTVRVPRSPLANLGVRPEELGLPADAATELEAQIEGRELPSGRLEGGGTIALHGARLRGIKTPVEVKVAGSASGAPGKPLDLERGSVSVGPFTAVVAGTITPHALGFALDATYRTVPIARDKLARAEAKSWGPLAAAVQEIAQRTGAARVTGTAQATGLVRYDTRAPDAASLTFTTRETCGLSIFGM